MIMPVPVAVQVVYAVSLVPAIVMFVGLMKVNRGRSELRSWLLGVPLAIVWPVVVAVVALGYLTEEARIWWEKT